MDLATAILIALISEPHVALIWAIPAAFVLLLPSLRLWWIHGLLAIVLLIAAIVHYPDRDLAFEAFAIGVAIFPILCRQIPSNALVMRYGILWFGLFSLIAALIVAGTFTARQTPIEPDIPSTEDTISAGGIGNEKATDSGRALERSRRDDDASESQRLGMRGAFVRSVSKPIMA